MAVSEQKKSLRTLQDTNDETDKRISVLHESVANKERVMEARARICSDRVFLIEAAAGRKDDVYNAIETLFKTSQNTSERQTVPPSHIVKNIFEELYSSISLPGVRFVGQGQNWFHRYLWVILHLTTFSISFNYIKEAYDTWQDTPVVLSLNNTLTRVADIPFPAITLCSLPSISNHYNITQQVHKCFVCTNESTGGFCRLSEECTDEDVIALAAALALCNCREELTPSHDQLMEEILQNNLTGVDRFSTQIKNKILPKCDRDHLFLGEPPQHEYSCPHVHLSLMEFTDTPVCLTFNKPLIPATLEERKVTCKTLDSNLTWNMDNMLEFANKNDSVPLYRDKKIEIMFKKQKNSRVDTCNEGHDANSKIVIHHPGEVPMEDNTRFYSFRTERDINIYVSPTLITAQNNLRHHEPSVRGCYFSHEKNLTLFKFYTRKNCQMECKVNCSMDVCKCTPIFLPHELVDSDLSTASHPACRCDCLPDCVSLSYDFSIDDFEIDPKLKDANFTIITIKYKDLEFSSKLRYELRSLADFVADTGGFLGVFNGFSFMVLFELFYFLTVRLWSSIKKSWRLAEEVNVNSRD